LPGRWSVDEGELKPVDIVLPDAGGHSILLNSTSCRHFSCAYPDNCGKLPSVGDAIFMSLMAIKSIHVLLTMPTKL